MCPPVWRDRLIMLLATNPVVVGSSPATDKYVMHCWLISPNKLNVLPWLLAYLNDIKVHSTNFLLILYSMLQHTLIQYSWNDYIWNLTLLCAYYFYPNV